MNFTYDKQTFLMDGTPFSVRSGAIHYFRVPKEYWHDRLLKLKECGMNTVETYVAWNAHESKEGVFDFTDRLDLACFLDTAKELGLYAIVRPGPYICAEWEAGGLPAWLLGVPGMVIRCDNTPFLKKTEHFFAKLFEILTPRLCTHGGNILMLQVENEYGSYGNDKSYLKKLERMMRSLGADCLLFRSDGDDPSMMHSADTGIYTAANFGSDPAWHLRNMRVLGYDDPFFCGEYWCGWFDHWYEQHHLRSAENVASETDVFLQNCMNFNFYMFHGGTNFGFWSGANDLPGTYLPTTTSYDYDGLLDEAGVRTEKYYAVRDVISKYAPVPELTATDVTPHAYGNVVLTESAPLFSHLSEVSSASVTSASPQTFEQMESYYGYLLYETVLTSPHGKILYPDPIADRVSVYADGERLGVLEHGREHTFPTLPEGEVKLQLLCENMGRVNYGVYTLDEKGLKFVRTDFRRLFGWKTTALPMDDLSGLTYEPFCESKTPAFHRGTLHIDGTPTDTYLSMDGWHKGFVCINGRNLGRYFTDAGPQVTLYVPGCYLKTGDNEIVIFESEQTETNTVRFSEKAKFSR